MAIFEALKTDPEKLNSLNAIVIDIVWEKKLTVDNIEIRIDNLKNEKIMGWYIFFVRTISQSILNGWFCICYQRNLQII